MAGSSATSIPIDPLLLDGNVTPILKDLPSLLVPEKDENGHIMTSCESFKAILASIRKKEPLQAALVAVKRVQSIPKSWSLEKLRNELLEYWYPGNLSTPVQSNVPNDESTPIHLVDHTLALTSDLEELPLFMAPRSASPRSDSPVAISRSVDNDEEALVYEFGVRGADAHELLGYGDDDDEDTNDDVFAEGGNEEEEEDLRAVVPNGVDVSSYRAFQTQVRIEAVQRAEGNRRIGGIRTQQAMVRAWNEFTERMMFERKIPDTIVDEHSLLLFIKFHAERPKRTRRGVEIPGTFVGASQLKKLFFGALRIRKEQDAADSSLALQRPATSVIVWDEVKTRMDIALKRARSGLVPGEDAPDIVANTFLAEITDEQLSAVGKGFLMHRELRSVIYGHLAWTTQNASGNRGDDIRALKLAELQPWTMRHPTQDVKIPTILGLQSEEKAGKRGMRTVINPVYTVWLPHRHPEMCPMGAFAIYLHYIHDVKDITSMINIDWTVNNTWRQARVLSGPKSPTTPFSDQSLYTIYVRGFNKGGLVSRCKAHLPRHMLGYKQEAMGVDPADTSQLGWVRGQTYFDTYRPAIPKNAVLAAHGYQTHEIYDPIWCHIHVPEQFLILMCPMAEEIYERVKGRPNLMGAANHWKLAMELRPYLFQCGAVLFEQCPQSALFRLPAFANQDVRNWMSTTFRTELSVLRAQAGIPIDRQRLENENLQRSLEDLRAVMSQQNSELMRLRLLLERRTAVMSPTQGFSMATYHMTKDHVSTSTSLADIPPQTPLAPFSMSQHARDSSGVYAAEDNSLRAFANPSPGSPNANRVPTQVDLILPPVAAFYNPDDPQMIWPPCLGQKSVRWTDVFKLIKQPQLCWEKWRPGKTLDQYKTVDEIWEVYTLGEPVLNEQGVQIGVRPPLRDVEQAFRYRWRTKGEKNQKKTWERFREIPEYIDHQSNSRKVSPNMIIAELEAMRIVEIMAGGGSKTHKMGLNQLMKELQKRRKDSCHSDNTTASTSAIPLPSNPHSPHQPPTSSPPTSPPVLHSSQTTSLGSPFEHRVSSPDAEEPQPGKRQRAPAVGVRVRAKKPKVIP